MGSITKKTGYKGDFLIKKIGDDKYYVIECKGLKTNAEFRSSKTEDNHLKSVSKKDAINLLKKYFNKNKESIFNKGYKTYLRAKEKWCIENPNKQFPKFKWDKECPGPDNVDLSKHFSSINELTNFINNIDDNLLTEQAFRTRSSAYRILQTHKPSSREDYETGIKRAAPLVSDFSILAVDLFQRTGKHEFVFMNPTTISHSPTSPNHLYQNYIIDIIIPGIKNDLCITHPWYLDLNECIKKTNPTTVEFDNTQIDYRE